MAHLVHWLTFSKYTVYIWSAYSVVGVVFLAQFIALKQKRKKIMRWLKQSNGVK